MSRDHLANFRAHGQLLENPQRIDEMVDFHSIKSQTLIINDQMDTVMDGEDVAIAAAQISQLRQ